MGKGEPVLTLDDEPVVSAPAVGPRRLAHYVARPQPPLWLVIVAGTFAMSLWAAPVAVGKAAGLNLGLGLLIGGVLAAVALGANAGIAFLLRLPVVAKVGLMSGVAVALTGVFFLGAHFAGWDQQQVAVDAEMVTPSQPQKPSPVNPSANPAPVPNPPPKPRTPPSHIDRAYFTGMSRLDDGPAAVTALALSPIDGALVVGYANGTTAVWALDQPSFMPPWAGPKGDGAVRRIQFDSTAELLYLTCDNGLIAAPLALPPAAPLKIPGERPAVMLEPLRDRFAAVRAGKLCVRLIPTDLAKKPPPVKAPAKFSLLAAKQEVIPSGLRPDYPVIETNPTFVAWHPNGRLLWGSNDGTVSAWPAAGPKPEVVSKEHKGAIRAWATNGTDFVTGDDKGMLGYWGNKAVKPTMFWNCTSAVVRIAFASWGREVAVADASGGISVWDLGAGRRAFELKRPAPVAVMSFGPSDDLLLLADGKGVEVWWIDALRKEALIFVPPK